MQGCQVKRGFFVLRDCGKVATATCNVCGRQMCDEHRVLGASSAICVDCNARKGRRTGGNAGDMDDVYRYRHSYYQKSDYHPIYGGSNYDTYYDQYDVRSFEPVEDEAEEEQGSGGFGVS